MPKYNKPSMRKAPPTMDRKPGHKPVSLAVEMTEVRLEKKHKKQRRA
jgi:hypothetical protein